MFSFQNYVFFEPVTNLNKGPLVLDLVKQGHQTDVLELLVYFMWKLSLNKSFKHMTETYGF